jgi:hypothetical protein
MSGTSTELDVVSSSEPPLKKTYSTIQNTDSPPLGKEPSDNIENPNGEPLVDDRFNLSKFKMTLIIINVTSVEFLRSVVEGMVIVQLPTIAADINLERGLSLW